MACSTACGAFHAYADGISDRQESETVQLFLKEMQAGKIDRSEKFANDSHHRARYIRCRAEKKVSNHSLSAFLKITRGRYVRQIKKRRFGGRYCYIRKTYL